MDLKNTTIKDILHKIESHKMIIATHRDRLREIYDELGDCLESFDRGVEGLDTGKRDIEIAIDAISEQI